jgi:hypothetical protein
MLCDVTSAVTEFMVVMKEHAYCRCYVTSPVPVTGVHGCDEGACVLQMLCDVTSAVTELMVVMKEHAYCRCCVTSPVQ